MFDGWSFTVICALGVLFLALFLGAVSCFGQTEVSDPGTHELLTELNAVENTNSSLIQDIQTRTNSILSLTDSFFTYTSSVICDLRDSLVEFKSGFYAMAVLLLFCVGVLTFLGMR